MKRAAILQSNYIPWKGYFDLIHMVDEFILYDDMQYTRRDWRNRNIIRNYSGTQWLSIPVSTKGKYLQKIRETEISTGRWSGEHWKALQCSYARAAHFDEYAPALKELYMECGDEKYLSMVNYKFIRQVCGWLGIHTKITWSSEYVLEPGRTERLAGICRQAGADEYISGPAAKDYIADSLFEEAGIKLSYIDYSGYPEYAQVHGGYVSNVSIIDMLFNLGSKAVMYMKSFDK